MAPLTRERLEVLSSGQLHVIETNLIDGKAAIEKRLLATEFGLVTMSCNGRRNTPEYQRMVQDKQRIRTAFDETKADLELVWEEQERRARALAGLL